MTPDPVIIFREKKDAEAMTPKLVNYTVDTVQADVHALDGETLIEFDCFRNIHTIPDMTFDNRRLAALAFAIISRIVQYDNIKMNDSVKTLLETLDAAIYFGDNRDELDNPF